MKLYSNPGACSLSCHIAFEEGKIPFEPMIGKRDEVAKLNPSGGVPLLVMDDGSLLTQNIAVLTYAASRAPQLLPKPGTSDYFQAYRWLAWTSSDLHPKFGMLFDDDLPEDRRKEYESDILELFAVVDQHLRGREFVVGNHFTIADALLFVVTGWAPVMEIPIEKFAALSAYRAGLAKRPSVIAATKREEQTG